jgi:hypothetical protein
MRHRHVDVDVGTCPNQVLADTLTLSQPEGADYAHPILVSTPSFESHRRACIRIEFEEKIEKFVSKKCFFSYVFK